MKNLLKSLFLIAAILALGAWIVQNAMATSAQDLASFSVMLVVNIILGLSSGLLTMYYYDKALELSPPGEPLSQTTWFRPAVLVGFDMAALGILSPIGLNERLYQHLITPEWVFWTITPAISALTLPAAFGLILGSFWLSDRPKSKKRIKPGSLCLV